MLNIISKGQVVETGSAIVSVLQFDNYDCIQFSNGMKYILVKRRGVIEGFPHMSIGRDKWYCVAVAVAYMDAYSVVFTLQIGQCCFKDIRLTQYGCSYEGRHYSHLSQLKRVVLESG